MSAGQWRVCQALTVALLVTSVFAVPGAGQTSDGPGGGIGDGTGTSDATSGDGTNGGSGTGDGCCGTGTGAEAGGSARAPTLSVLPDTGPPGAEVTVSGDGYRACFTPYDDVAPGAVAISWDGSSVATVDVDGGTVSAVLPVPDAAPPGAATVTATCLGDTHLTASAQFAVTAPGGTTDPGQTTDGTAQATDPGAPATDAEAESPAPTAGDAPPADPTPDPADPQPMDAAEAVSRTKAGAPVALLAALLVVLAAAAALLSLAVRARWGPAWAVAHVSAVPGTAARGALAVTPSAAGSPAATVVRLEPRPGTVTHVVEEVDR